MNDLIDVVDYLDLKTQGYNLLDLKTLVKELPSDVQMELRMNMRTVIKMLTEELGYD